MRGPRFVAVHMSWRPLTTKDEGRVTFVRISPTTIRWRWITREEAVGGRKRYYGRSPKIGVRVRDLARRRDADFGPERILPAGAKARG
jgi:hypothetical protein